MVSRQPVGFEFVPGDAVVFGRPGRYRHPRLIGLRASAVAKPFGDWLIFYWDRPRHVHLFRLMHGARDLPSRLVEGEPVA